MKTNGTIANRIATWSSILVLFLAGGMWAGEIENEQEHKADKIEVAEIKRDIQYIKEEVDELKEGQVAIRLAIVPFVFMQTQSCM